MDFKEKQRLNQEQLMLFREEKKDNVCAVCEGSPFGIARTKWLCRKHYKKIVADNKEKIKQGLDIPKGL